MKQITMLSNLIKLIENEVLTIESVKSHFTITSDRTEVQDIKPTDFVESILYLDKAKYFTDAVDFFYDFMDEKLYLEVPIKNIHMYLKYIVVCSIKDDVPVEEISTKLRRTIFDMPVKGNNQYSLPNNSAATQSDLAAKLGMSVVLQRKSD